MMPKKDIEYFDTPEDVLWQLEYAEKFIKKLQAGIWDSRDEIEKVEAQLKESLVMLEHADNRISSLERELKDVKDKAKAERKSANYYRKKADAAVHKAVEARKNYDKLHSDSEEARENYGKACAKVAELMIENEKLKRVILDLDKKRKHTEFERNNVTRINVKLKRELRRREGV